jgi:FAD/FMN-containing dehydrogenase
MQSYCTFSVGGTLAVNAHGITSDESMASCVVSLRVVTAENGVATLSEVTKDDALFGHVLGGYGLFGIVTSVTMITLPNHTLTPASLQLSISSGEFHR